MLRRDTAVRAVSVLSRSKLSRPKDARFTYLAALRTRPQLGLVSLRSPRVLHISLDQVLVLVVVLLVRVAALNSGAVVVLDGWQRI
jgi:hypothetical protein